MVKVFTPNKNGKIEFTKEELEALLNEVWNDGYNHRENYWWIPPTYYTGIPITNDNSSITITCGAERREE